MIHHVRSSIAPWIFIRIIYKLCPHKTQIHIPYSSYKVKLFMACLGEFLSPQSDGKAVPLVIYQIYAFLPHSSIPDK